MKMQIKNPQMVDWVAPAKEVASKCDVTVNSFAPAVVHSKVLDRMSKSTVVWVISKIPWGGPARLKRSADWWTIMVRASCHSRPDSDSLFQFPREVPGLGLRACELLSLLWGDVDFENLTVNVHRSVVGGEINPTKTTASEGTQPMDPGLGEILVHHKQRATFKADDNYVFAGPTGKR